MSLKIMNNKGVALILAIMVMTLMLFMSLYYVNFSISENKIASSQVAGEKTYYLAESGVSELIWKIKNDADFKNNFENNPTWSTSTSRENPFGVPGESYSASITNTGLAAGDITATGTATINGKKSQRVIKTKVYRLIGLSGMGTNAIVNGTGTIEILNSDEMIVAGDIFTNSSFDMQGDHPVTIINGNLTSVATIDDGNGNLQVSGTTTDIYSIPAPEPMLIPGVNFDDLYNQSTSKLANDAALDATTTISGITWASTTVDIENSMVINGLLVVNGNLTIADSADITVNHSTGSPSGIIVYGNITIIDNPDYNGNINIRGLLYATGKITFEKLNMGHDFNITGGITSGNGLLIKNCSRTININYDNEILVSSLNSTSSSPVIAIEHWEEEY